ncbi:TPA: helix-turn-helix transcriptional regulator [Candidatus Avigastranaerophilus faecigallinarum]|nr:helix-turn-helix transcriptional regulator [Candidatus Avigastranaerophilus faecigallinarum]
MQDTKKELLKITGNIIKKYRGIKSISLLSNEIELSKSIWSEVEKGNKDIQLTTLWRISEGLNIKPSELIKEIENMLGKDFSFLENNSNRSKK